MLREAGNIGALATAPWLLAPAVAIVSVVFAVNLLVDTATPRRGASQARHSRSRPPSPSSGEVRRSASR
jgi:ABC-type dipeptide/oligopeptide/nickel transport system permease subunit